MLKSAGLAVMMCVTVALAASGTSLHASEVLDRVIAVVSGTIITLSDARAAIAFGLVDVAGQRDPVATAMEWLVDRQLVLDEVSRYESADLDSVQVDAVFAEVRRKLETGRTFDAALAQFGLDQDGARRFVRDTVRVQQYLKRRFESILPGTDDELRERYAARKSQFVRDGRLLSFEEARDLVQADLQDERRVLAVDAWLARLRRRTDVNELYLPVR